MKMVVTILAGGSGSRLWPLSRDNHPKPFIRLADGQSLLQKTFLRAVELPLVTEVLTVTNRELIYLTLDDYAEVNHGGLQTSFILEPVGRDTAPAIATAALKVANEHGPDTLMLVLSADHLIADKAAFHEAVNQAVALSAQGNLVTFGIHAKSPETGFGYIESDGNKVLRFVEKPSAEKAQAYIDAGNFHWNSGMFCFTADALIKQMAAHAPEIHQAVKTCLDLSSVEKMPGGDRLLLDSASFEAVPKNSIDYALMEKSKQVSVVPCDIGWSDIGSWLALTDLITPDAMNNRANGDVLLHDAKNVSVHATDKLVSVIGLSDIIVVDTGDALLVVNKQDAQKVKLIYDAVKNADDARYRLHDEVHRPWGTYKVLQNAEAFKVKRILVKPGHRLSLQSHQYRAEHWVVVKGTAEVMNNEQRLILKEGESTFIEAGHLHQLYNPSATTLEIIEVQTGTYLGEDDIQRYSDDYGRQ